MFVSAFGDNINLSSATSKLYRLKNVFKIGVEDLSVVVTFIKNLF